MAQRWNSVSSIDLDEISNGPGEESHRPTSWIPNTEQGPHFAPRSSTTDSEEGVNEPAGPSEIDDAASPHMAMVGAPAAPRSESFVKRWSERMFSNGWGAEVLGLVLSMLALVALLVILAYYNGRPLSSFGNSTSVNAVISILISVTEFALVFAVAEALCQQKWIQLHSTGYKGRPLTDLQVFDRAAYTTIGALSMFKTGVHRNVASLLGCVVIITHLFVGPFTQQAVSYPVRYTGIDDTANSEATIAKAQSFFREWESSGSPLVSPIRLAVTAAMDQPITNTTLAATWTCPSGNCTFPTFETAGLCSSCVNVTDKLRLTCAGEDESRPARPYTHDFFDVDLLHGGPYPGCNITFPSNVSLAPTVGTFGNFQFTWQDKEGWQKYNWNDSASYDDHGAQWDLLTDFSFSRLYGSTLGDIGFPLATLDTFHSVLSETPENHTMVVVYPLGMQCALSLCAQTHANVSIEGGRVNPGQVTSWLPGLSSVHGSGSKDATISLQRSSLVAYQGLAAHIPDFNSSGSVNVNQSAINEILTGISTLFNSETPNGQPKWTASEGYSYDITTADKNPQEDTTSYAYFQTPDVEAHFELLAQTATNGMRNYAGPYGEKVAQGVSLGPVVYIHVHWEWLIMAIVVVLMGIVFVGWTIVQNARHRLPVWKSSTLATVYHGPKDDLDEDATMEYVTDMNGKAKHCVVQLERMENGRLRLVQVPKTRTVIDEQGEKRLRQRFRSRAFRDVSGARE